MPYAGPEQGYKITPAQLEAAITPRTRLLILNSPNNPTGAAYTRGELAALGEVLARHPQVLICTDDMYEHIYWGPEPFCSSAECRSRTLRPDRDGQWGLEELCNDWLADRLLRRSGGDRGSDGYDSEPEHDQPKLNLAESRDGRA